MSQNLKYILTFVIAAGFIALCFYGLTVYDKHKSREYDLTETEIKNNRVIDSLKVKVYQDSITVSNLLTAKETEKTNRTEYNANYQKRKEIISKTSYNDDKSFNDRFILNFQPKY